LLLLLLLLLLLVLLLCLLLTSCPVGAESQRASSSGHGRGPLRLERAVAK